MILPQYKDAYEKSGYCGYTNPYAQRHYSKSILPSGRLQDKVFDLIGEQLFYENHTNIYFGDFRIKHKEEIERAVQAAVKQEEKELWIITAIIAVIALGLLIFFFDLIIGIILFIFMAGAFTIQALKEGGNVG